MACAGFACACGFARHATAGTCAVADAVASAGTAEAGLIAASG
jgi:hypothetical protein